MEQLNEVVIIWAAELRRTVRSARVIVLLALYLMLTALALMLVYAFVHAAQTRIDDQIALSGVSAESIQPQLDKMKHGFLGWWFEDDDALLESLTRVPLIVLITFSFALFWWPFFIAIMGFDQISGEIGPRSIRYLTVRARRSSILWGKLLAQGTLMAALALGMDTALVLVGRWLTPSFQPEAMAATLLKCWLAATVFSFAFVALSSLCSALFRSSAVSLIFNFFVLLIFLLLNVVGYYANLGVKAAEAAQAQGGEGPGRVVSALSYSWFASPWHYSTNLLHPHLLKFLGSTAIYAGFAAAFLACGYAVLRRRDL